MPIAPYSGRHTVSLTEHTIEVGFIGYPDIPGDGVYGHIVCCKTLRGKFQAVRPDVILIALMHGRLKSS